MLFMNENGTETVDESNYRGKWYRYTITRITLFYTSAFFNGVHGDGTEVQKWKFREVEIRSVSSEGEKGRGKKSSRSVF